LVFEKLIAKLFESKCARENHFIFVPNLIFCSKLVYGTIIRLVIQFHFFMPPYVNSFVFELLTQILLSFYLVREISVISFRLMICLRQVSLGNEGKKIHP